MNPALELTDLLTATLRVCAAGIAVQSLEVLALRRELAPAGLLGWRSAAGEGLRARVAGAMNGLGASTGLLAVRLGVALACVVLPWTAPATFWCVVVLVVLQLAYNRRFAIIAGNCETMFLLELFALAVAAQPGASAALQAIALGFVAAHAALAYLVAGLHKLGSIPWCTGARLQQIVRHGSYELPEPWARSLRERRAAAIASWAVIGLELALPFAIFFPSPLFGILLGAGFLFHTGIALALGLHGFWWSFAAAYPALVFAHGWWH
jgi:hypothetical protein